MSELHGYYWREWHDVGGQVVAGPFDTAVDAGVWRRDNPPIFEGQGPTLVKFEAGYKVDLEPGELADAFTQFAHVEERPLLREELTRT